MAALLELLGILERERGETSSLVGSRESAPPPRVIRVIRVIGVYKSYQGFS